MKLMKIIQKNFKLLFKSRFASFIVLFGPLLVILLVGYAFNNFGGYRIQVGTYSSNYSSLAKEYIVEMSDSNFKVTKYPSEDECIQDIKYGGIHTCLVFPKDFDILNINNTLKFYVDPSNTNLVWMVMDEVSKKIKSRSSKVSLNITQDIMSKIRTSKRISHDSLKLISLMLKNFTASQEYLNSTKLDTNKIKFTSDLSDVSLNTATLDTSVTNLYTDSKKSKDTLDSIYSDIKSSDTWSQLNSTQKDDLEDIMDSGSSSMDSLITTLDTDYSSFSDKLEDLTLNVYNLTKTIDNLKSEVSSIEAYKTKVLSDLDKLSADISSLSYDVITLKNNYEKIYSELSAIKITNAKSIVSPVSTTIIPVVKDKNNMSYLYPALIILIILFVGLLLSSLNIVLEKNSRAFFRNFVTPTSDDVFLTASFLSSMIVLIIQVIIILLFTYLLFNVDILQNLKVTLLILVMSMTFFTLLGMIIGYLFSSEEAAILGTISLSSVLFFLSDLVVPVSALPDTIRWIIDLNPFIKSTSLLKRSLLFNVSFTSLQSDILLFLFYILGAIIVLFIIHRLTKIRQFYYNSQKHKKVDVADDVIIKKEKDKTKNNVIKLKSKPKKK